MKNWQTFACLLLVVIVCSGSALYAELPAAGVDRFDAIMEISIQLGGNTAPLKFLLTGPVTVARGAPQPLRGGGAVITTEIVSLELIGTDPAAFGPAPVLGVDPSPFKVKLVKSPTAPSMGEIRTDGRSVEGAHSFFDVFFDLHIGEQKVSNLDALHLEAIIDAVPPLESAYLAGGLNKVPVRLSGGGTVQDAKFIPSEPSHALLAKELSIIERFLRDILSKFPSLFDFLGGVTISGLVKDLNNNPVPGLLVFAGTAPSSDGSTALTSFSKDTTDQNGAYWFKVPKGSSGFVFVVPPPGVCATSSPNFVNIQQDLVHNFTIGCAVGR